MDKFFLKTLETLHVKTGLLQYEKLKDSLGSGEKISMLITELVRSCKRFGHVPEDVKQRIITENIMQDVDLKALTPSKVFHWLSNYWNQLPQANKQKFIYPEKEETHEPCPPEKAQEYIDKLKKQLANLDYSKQAPKKSGARFIDKGFEATKMEQRTVNCPGVGQEGCSGDNCSKCNGWGKIKVTVKIG